MPQNLEAIDEYEAALEAESELEAEEATEIEIEAEVGREGSRQAVNDPAVRAEQKP